MNYCNQWLKPLFQFFMQFNSKNIELVYNTIPIDICYVIGDNFIKLWYCIYWLLIIAIKSNDYY